MFYTNSVSNAMITNSTITIQDDSSTQDAVALGETLIFEGGSGVTTTVTDNKVSIANVNTNSIDLWLYFHSI